MPLSKNQASLVSKNAYINYLHSFFASSTSPAGASTALAVGANLLFCLIFAPYLQNTNGMGAITRATQPRRVLAQLTPRALNMYVAKRGKTAPARERRKVFAATAEAALWGGESVGY